MNGHPSRHVILGGSGFIGRHVALVLARAGHAVTIASRHPLGFRFPAAESRRIQWQRLDWSPIALDRLVDGADCVHHYAWGTVPATAQADPVADRRLNLILSQSIIDALCRRRAGRLLFASSGGTVYGPNPSGPTTEATPLAPATPYAITKAMAESLMLRHRDTIDCLIARISNPYGAGQDPARCQGAVTTFIDTSLAGRPITLWGDGAIVRDYIHVTDVARCLAALACAPVGEHAVFNIGTGIGTSLNQLVGLLERLLDRPIPVRRLPARPFDVPINILSPDRAARSLGWSASLSLEQGIRRTLDDLRNARLISTLDACGDTAVRPGHGCGGGHR